ncbi:MAG: LuxR family transcriptional regulator [Burkholderiales bacterium]|nr:LuxR family transcriptional regulator [Burkholderiales bacterium]
MLKLLALGNASVRAGQPLPPLLDPLVDAAQRGQDLASRIAALVASFGFDSIEYSVAAPATRDRPAMRYAYTTIPEWVRHYEEMGYRDADPRAFLTSGSAIPLIWDQASVRGYGASVDAFLADARAHGIASGVSFGWHGAEDIHVVVALNAPAPHHDDVRYQAITRNLPDIVMFGHYFHEVFALPAMCASQARPPELPALTRRERECLALAARGMTTRQIAAMLGMSSRTVQLQFERICGKFGAANRPEAIAVAVQAGLVRTQ